MKSMSIEFFIARSWRYVSLAALVFFLLWTYTGMPDAVAVHFDNQGVANGFLPKTQVFYVIMALVLVFNILPLMLIKPINQLPDAAISILPIKKEWQQNREEFNESISNWLIVLPAIVNTIMLFSIKILGKLNDVQYHSTFSDYNWLAIFILVLFVIWIFYLPVKLLFTKP